MTMKLFDDSGDDVEEISKIEVDEKFAKRFDHNKKREDLQRFEELKKKGLIEDSDSDSDSESSSEDDVDIASKKKDIEFLDALLKVRNKDPILKDTGAALFALSEGSEEEDEQGKGEKGDKQMKKKKYLKDVMAQHLIEEGPEFEEREEIVKKGKSYAEEQEEIRKQLLDAVAEAEREDGDAGDLFREKEREGEEEEEDDEVKKKLDEYFGDDEKLDENEMFLKDFFKNKMWVDHDEGKEGIDGDLIGVSEDEEELEKQEDFEREYNFRFEENAGDRVLGHSRFVEGSVRKKENARKRQRESKEERMARAEMERKEEVKRLKNLKKKEITDKLNRIREIAGLGEDGGIPLTADDLEEEFDPEEYDKKMNAAFGEQYYGADDPEFGSDMDEDRCSLEKPNFDKEDELLGLPKDWDVCKPGDGFLAERERYLKSKVEDDGADPQGEGDEKQPREGKRKRKRKLSLKEKVALEKDLEELYKLDYEDSIGDLKTRFKYKTVTSRRYGLNPVELLLLDEKDLNQYVSLKKLAPYQEQEWKVPRIKRATQRKLLQEKLAEQMYRRKASKRHASKTIAKEARNHKNEEPSDDVSRRKKRRAELKLSQSRLVAYGMIKMPLISKKKSKH
ncbi:hypothetical protein Dimus_021526 [Dionaea muscipula]